VITVLILLVVTNREQGTLGDVYEYLKFCEIQSIDV
jgi:hypothetical protein